VPPPTSIIKTVSVREFDSSAWNLEVTRRRGPMYFWRAWHCSQVSAEETRRLVSMADSIGLGKELKITSNNWRVPAILAFSQPLVP